MYLGLSISEKKIFRGTAEQTEIMNFLSEFRCFAEKKTLGIPFQTIPRQKKTLGILFWREKGPEFSSKPFTAEKNARNFFRTSVMEPEP
jgi:hypothetical protein